MNLAERVSLLDRQYIDPEELLFSQPADEFQEIPRNLSRSSTQSSQDPEFVAFAESYQPDNFDSMSSVGSKQSFYHAPVDTRHGKAYAPRATVGGRKSTKAALRVKPKNGQHARELERNRHAAANYRSRQKNQLDDLLTRVREEEDRMVKQKAMVYSLKDELWHLRNDLMARQQMQILGSRNMEAGGTIVPQQSINFGPAFGMTQ